MIKTFLCTGWGKKGPVGRSGLFLYELECTGGRGKQFFFFENMKKKSPSRPFLGHTGGGQETVLYFRVASCCVW